MSAERPADLWRLVLEIVDLDVVPAALTALETECPSVSAFESPGGWRVEGLSRDKPNLALVEAALLLVREGKPAKLSLERMPARDWVAENQASFPPLSVGRFFIHGSHYRNVVPPASIPILIDAATAFGTGEHATTRGCLLAMEKMGRRPRGILDMGCGTGILAVAAAKLWHTSVLACDIDPESVRVARVNAARNQVAAGVRAERATGYLHREIARRAPFDLVLANILARPLMSMSGDLARVLAPGGVAVLSGLLARQEPAVLTAHRAQGLFLRHRIAIEGWHTLVLARRV